MPIFWTEVDSGLKMRDEIEVRAWVIVELDGYG
jgi:hypothetical protein